MHWPERGQIYLQHIVFVYLANTAVLCYSLTIICCCQVKNYIYWLISTENDHRHHQKFIKYEKRLRKEGNMLGLPIIKQNFATSAWDLTRSTSLSSLHPTATVQLIPTYILHLFHLEDTSLLFLFISESVKVRFLPRVDLSLPTCCLLFIKTAHAQDGFT